MPYQSFKELTVWKEARDLAVSIYKLTHSGPLSRDFGLKDQMQRSSVSVPSNIAEGYERSTDKEFLHFLDIASGSLSELRTQLDISMSINYSDKQTFDVFEDQCCKIGAMLTNLKRSRRSRLQR